MIQIPFDKWFIIYGFVLIVSGISTSNDMDLDAASSPSDLKFCRPNPAVIKETTQEILSQRRYAPRKSFWQWVGEKFSSIDGPDWKISPVIGEIIITLIIIWCILALVAIFAHLIWTLYVFFRPIPLHNKSTLHSMKGISDRSYEQLYAMAGKYASQGKYCQALEFLMLAMLSWMDRKRILRFHESKTNGDYINEYPPINSKSDFKMFTVIFDKVIYGQTLEPHTAFNDLKILADKICTDVCEKTK